MKAEWKLADRRRAVRVAARGWQRAGAIDERTLAAIDARYVDDRARLGPVFRTLAFVLGVFALNAFFGLIALVADRANGFAVACLVFAALLVGATEVLMGPLRRADSGIETATALLAVVYALVGSGMLLRHSPERALVPALLGLATLLAAVASVRWGSGLLAAVAAITGFVLLARVPGGRVLWLLVSALLGPLLLRASESARLPPAHRLSARLALIVAVCAFYVAVHVGSWDYRWLEWLADFRDPHAGEPRLRPLFVAATALVPPAVIAFGAGTRRAYLLDLGVLLAVASLVTLRFYVHFAPAWLVLAASGAVGLLLTLALRRWLASGPAGERSGLTAEPLFEDASRLRVAEVAGAVLAFAPGPQTPRVEEGIRPGGGRFGGGGATGEF